MLIRIISSIVALPILIALILIGGLPLRIAVLLVSMIGLREFYKAFSKQTKVIHYVGYLFSLFYLLFMSEIINQSNLFNIFVSLFMVTITAVIVICHKDNNVYDALITCFGFFYVCFLFSHIYLIREYTHGEFFVWLVFISAWGCDTGAYFTGVTIGKHKLIPDLSPKKTIEGSIGGVVLATLIAFIYGYYVETQFMLEGVNTILLCVITGIIGSILAQIGDLAASAIKRHAGIKDYGNLIPGHGGILDRFDSVLFTAPAVYYVMFFLIKLA